MRTIILLLIVVTTTIFSIAHANERPFAQSLAGEWWVVATDPLVNFDVDRTIRPDFPQLSPSLDEAIPPEMRSGVLDMPLGEYHGSRVTVPGAWEQALGVNYNQAGWYLHSFELPAALVAPEERFWLEFDGVATVAGVWLNGEWLGGHVGDYARWRLEATGVAREGQNRLLVYVDELPGHITQGFLNMIAPHHGGIWQDVRYYTTGPVAIAPDGVHIKPDPATGRVEAVVEIDGEWDESWKAPGFYVSREGATPEENELFISHYEDSFEWSFDAAQGVLNMSLTVPDVKLWNPDNPVLYTAVIDLPDMYDSNLVGTPSDKVVERFGFRTIEIQGSEVLLNGQPIYLRSALNWGMYPRVISPDPGPAAIRREFAYLKSIGFNAETVCLMNMPDYFYDIADEMGMLIWQEYPTWHNDFTAQHLPTYRREFPAYLRRDRNHPSIILRSISVEAGVDDQDVMAELYRLAKGMTDTPVQDNNSWFWLSNPETADWYGEDNYFDNGRWARHLLFSLPEKLDELEEKPYIIGESVVCNPWPDIDALKGVLAGEPLADGLIGTDGPDTIRNGEDYPWWFPSCYESCIAVEEQLRSYYNERLDGGADIVYDYLLPQSMYHSVQYRRFQFELLHADPRYRGYTTNVVRDIPFLRGGLLTYTGEPRYPREWWDWHGDHMQPQVTAAEVAERPAGQPLAERVPELLYFQPEWSGLIDRETPLYYLESGYQELAELVTEWPMAEPLPHSAVAGLDPTDPHGRSVVLTSVLTYDLVDYIKRGGAVVLFASKWPGGLGSYPVHHWRSAAFFPPVGPWAQQLPQDMAASPGGTAAQLALDLHQFDLTVEHTSQVAVGDLGLIEYVDPLVRLFDTHDLREVKQRDQLFMSRVGDGLLAVTCLNHATAGGQWVLGEVVAWADEFAAMGGADAAGGEMFPWARMPLEKARELATARPNAIILLDDPWRFRLDEAQAGAAAGWMNPDFAVDDWDWINVASSWESEGYSYDGMAWYRTEVDIPAEWDGARVKLIAEGIDDAYVVWVNGEAVAKHGSFTVHEETVWQLQTESDISDYIIPGENNTLVLQVVDITGGGGVWKPLYLAVEEQTNNE